MDYNNLLVGLRTQTQIPLDIKTYASSEATLSNLGTDNNLAFIYQQGLTVYCVNEGTRWEWREKTEDDTDGLVVGDFTYPSDTPTTFGITYADKVFNFFPINVNGEPGPKGDDGDPGAAATITLGTVTTGIAGSSVIITNTGTSSAAVFNFTIPKGDKGDDGVDASLNLQKTITYPTDFTGTDYTVTDADNNYTIIINNGAQAVNVIVPTGLLENISVGFFRQGSSDVTFTTSGTTINSPAAMKKFRVQYSNAYIEQVGNSNIYQLCGDLKS